MYIQIVGQLQLHQMDRLFLRQIQSIKERQSFHVTLATL